MIHDRVHAREPHDADRYTVGELRGVTERDGHAVITVTAPDGEPVELVVTLAVRDLFLDRLPDGSPVGERVWYRKKG